MQYPLISEYIEALQSAEDNFDKLATLRPVTDDSGSPIMSSGNFAVVFKMRDECDGKLYALKCFTKDQAERAESYKLIADELEFVQSPYLTKVAYYDKELFVDTQSSDDSEFPVLLMDWVEGMTLGNYLRKNINDSYALEMLAYNFSRMAMWLLSQPFAHGDLKPDNILVRPDGSLTLVDYDGMFVPAMQGSKSREVGSPDFRHPLRTENDFDEHIDDFPAISILLSLRLIASGPSLLGASDTDRLLFSENDYRDLSSCALLKTVFPSLCADINILVSLFTVACTCKTLSNVSLRLLAIAKPQKPEILSTRVTKEDLENGVEDEFGGVYSKDGKRLLRCKYGLKSYRIKEGTKVICDEAFEECLAIKEILIPSCVVSIGEYAFADCNAIKEIAIPSSVTSIGKGAFARCRLLTEIAISSSVKSIGVHAFIGCRTLQYITIPSSVTSIERAAFYGCHSLTEIVIPSSVTSIGDSTFDTCRSLTEITIPASVNYIGKKAFYRCRVLKKIRIPKDSRAKFEQIIPKGYHKKLVEI